MLQFLNSLSRQKEPFSPLHPPEVTIYVCGVTVYDRCHIGHGRCYVVWDTLRRYLKWRGYQVNYVQNFTDIDDKIIQRANQQGRPWQEVVTENVASYAQDMALLNIAPADCYPRATESLPEILSFIDGLMAKGFAYQTAGGVYYAVRKFADYGKLSGKKIDDLDAGASGRMTSDELTQKQDALDFLLWKPAKPEEPAWESDFGPGRPGWHIECSAMIHKHLGMTIDIHAGGEDLYFPHHENEIAQSEALYGQPLAQLWMHNAYITLNGEKMSKSLGNYITIADAAQKYAPLSLRLLALQSHYRTAIDFTFDSLAAAQKAWRNIEAVVQFGYTQKFSLEGPVLEDYIARFTEVMDNDLNTPQGLAVVFELVKQLLPERNNFVHGVSLALDQEQLATLWRTLLQLLEPLGLHQKLEPASIATDRLAPETIETLIAQRRTAKENRDFATADHIREELLAQGVVLVDHRDRSTTYIRQDE
jgi:cysteinyl-tRNA synthetase